VRRQIVQDDPDLICHFGKEGSPKSESVQCLNLSPSVWPFLSPTQLIGEVRQPIPAERRAIFLISRGACCAARLSQ
jgi:hypothetical protein